MSLSTAGVGLICEHCSENFQTSEKCANYGLCDSCFDKANWFCGSCGSHEGFFCEHK